MPSGKLATDGDPLVGFNFALELGGSIAGFFTSVSGLGSETAVTDHLIVGPSGSQIIRKIPGRLTWGDIELSRGVTANMDLWAWRKQVEDGKVAEARTDGSIVMYDQEGTEVARFNFEKGWPSNISSGDLGADTEDVVVETLTIVHEFIERVK
jgi:phage tail-like protein